ncbi:hypothetical protein DSAG12_03889 [Promethearchaeum syntrophicum]|uniref:Peptidase family M50 n=1 Tax=Promethearchaeum syntrophicum TaxID=2594042 RepID=A0A5B9DG97_9ARCH|nr:hypothetical protein [Candidatus Prometheoarchaeum syntrophicum]QEE18051.1 hypothetical protein DSAG12_03889 [Candidatus Prometheoarchaeum syntrophicum]
MENNNNNQLDPDKKEIVANNQDLKIQNSILHEDNEDNEQILFFKQKIEKILKEYVTVFEVEEKNEIEEKERIKDTEDDVKKILPEFIICITRKDSIEELEMMKDHLNQSGFKFTLNIIKKEDPKDYANRKEIIDYIDSVEKKNYGNNSISNDDRIHKYTLFRMKFNPISPLFYQKMKKKSRNNILDRKKINLNLTRLSLSLLGLALFIVIQVNILTDHSDFTSSFLNSFGTSDEETKKINILYLVLGFVSIILVREITYLITSRIRDVKYETPYFASLDNLSVKKLNPNNMFDLAASRILSGFLCSLLLLIMGLVLSEQIPTSLLISNKTGDHINRYNLLTQLLKNLFFSDQNNFIEILYGDSTYLLPKYTILMHPLAYAGHLGLLLTLFSIFPIQYTDGGKMYYAVFRNKYGHWIGLALVAVLIATLIVFSEYVFLIIAIFLITGIKIYDSKYQIEDLKFNLYPISKGRKKFLILFVILIVLIFPISTLVNFFGYLY